MYDNLENNESVYLSQVFQKNTIKFNEDGTDDITKLSILKNRHTGKNVSIELKYDDVRHRFYSSSMMEELNVNYLDDRFQQINIDDSDLPF